MVIEKFSFLDAVYMTVITITTIGYGEVHPLSHDGKIFNIIFIITSFTTITFALARFTQTIISGELQEYFKHRKMIKELNKMNDHVIICGFGRNGQQAAQTLISHKCDFVVIECNEENIEHYQQQNPSLLYIEGNATDDEILKKAGIERAKSLICTLPSDADNVFIVLSARSLNPSIQIISRASNESSVLKLKKAGADNVIMPDRIGGKHMATLVSKPDVIEFIDFLSGDEGESIYIESVDYDDLPSELKKKSLQEIMNWKKTGVNCIGIKDEDGKFIINPPENTPIMTGMKIIVLGNKSQIKELKTNVNI